MDNPVVHKQSLTRLFVNVCRKFQELCLSCAHIRELSSSHGANLFLDNIGSENDMLLLDEWRLLSQLFSRSVNFRCFQNCRNSDCLLKMTYIFRRCRRSLAVVSPVIHEGDSNEWCSDDDVLHKQFLPHCHVCSGRSLSNRTLVCHLLKWACAKWT